MTPAESFLNFLEHAQPIITAVESGLSRGALSLADVRKRVAHLVDAEDVLHIFGPRLFRAYTKDAS
jgi:hypothetical protein